MKNETMNIKCLSLDNNGEGLFITDTKKKSFGKAPGILPGERAIVSSLPTQARPGEVQRYRVVEILSTSRERIEASCPLFPLCGGCALLEARESFRREFLRAKVKEAFKSASLPFKPTKEIWDARKEGYRDKFTLAFGFKGSNITMGLFQAGTRRIVPLEDGCRAQSREANAIARTVLWLLKEMHISIYDEKSGCGLVRYLEIREAVYTHSFLVTIVSSSLVFPGVKEFARRLVMKQPAVKSVVLNVNPRHTPVVLSNKSEVIYGPSFIRESFEGITYRLSSRTFFQVNAMMALALYKELRRMAGLAGKEVVYDAYSGVGTIGLFLARSAKEVIGIESNADSVALANASARDNGIKNARFREGDASVFLKNAAAHGAHADVVIMDPPRSGSTPVFLDSLLAIAPQKILYVSCGPESLGRDLKILLPRYEVKETVLVDMFPGTSHVETVVLMSRKET